MCLIPLGTWGRPEEALEERPPDGTPPRQCISTNPSYLGSGDRSKCHEGDKDDAHEDIASLHGVFWVGTGLDRLV